MKIAYVIVNANRREGTSRAVIEVAERLADDHDVHLFARTVEDTNLALIKWHHIPGVPRPEVADFQSFKTIVDLRLNPRDFEIIHSAGPNTKRANVYTIQTVHTVKMQQIASARSEDSAKLFRRFAWWLYDKAVLRAEMQSYRTYQEFNDRVTSKAFLPVSEGTKQELLTCYPACHRAILEIIPNGADLAKFTPINRLNSRRSLEKEFSLKESDFLVLFSGGDWRRKGLDLALQALAAIKDASIKLLVAGNDRAGADIREMATQLRIEDRVIFAGFRNDVEVFYAGCDLFLFPTVYEAFSLATIEAAASGLPVLMSNVSGAAELVGSGEAGEIIPRDPGIIAKAVMRYVGDPMLRAQKSLQARQLVERQFSWDAIADKTFKVYQQITNASKTPK